MRDDIRSIVVDKLLDGRPVADDDELLLSGLVTSLGIIRLVRLLEQTLPISVPAEDVIIEHFESIDAIVAYAETRLAR